MNKIEALLKRLPHHLQVSFALYCAIDAKTHLKSGSNAEAKASAAIELTKKWLSNPNSVSSQELINAAYAYAAYAAAAYAANAYAAAADAAAANAAANAAAANAAADAYTAAGMREKKLKEYETELREMIKEISELERVIYKLEL